MHGHTHTHTNVVWYASHHLFEHILEHASRAARLSLEASPIAVNVQLPVAVHNRSEM